EGEAFFGNQPPADRIPPGVIFSGAVRGFSQEHIAGVSNAVQQRVQISRRPQGASDDLNLLHKFRRHRGLKLTAATGADHRRASRSAPSACDETEGRKCSTNHAPASMATSSSA